MTKPTILVTGAAGKTSFATAMQLLEKDYPVRALVRRQSPRAEMLRDAGAEIRVGDLLDIRDVRKALDGVHRAYYCFPVAPNPLHASMIFAAAAEEAGLEVVTKMTQWFAQPTHPSFFTREHWLADQVMPWMPNVDVVTVNPGLFADIYFLVLAPVAQLGVFPMPLGNSLNAPPSNEDIARVAVGTLIDPAPHVGKSYRPTGPVLLSPDDIAATFSRVLGRKVRYMNVSPKMFLKAATAQGYPAFQIAQLHHYLEEHRRTALTVNAPNDTVRTVGGREAEDFETIARRYIAERPEAAQTFGNKLEAMQCFARMLVTPAPDIDEYERRQDHPSIENPEFSSESEEWIASHDGQDRLLPVSLNVVHDRVGEAAA